MRAGSGVNVAVSRCSFKREDECREREAEGVIEKLTVVTIGGDEPMAIHVDTCGAQGTIVVTTRSSVYELVVRGGPEDVMVRGGSHFAEVTRVRFPGSIADDGSLEPHAIGIGLRMTFVSGGQCVITSPVQSVSCRSEGAAA